jgi:hypothetical protein
MAPSVVKRAFSCCWLMLRSAIVAAESPLGYTRDGWELTARGLVVLTAISGIDGQIVASRGFLRFGVAMQMDVRHVVARISCPALRETGTDVNLHRLTEVSTRHTHWGSTTTIGDQEH